MLTDRIVGAFTFRKDVYADVEHDTSFTQTAWLIVIIVAFFNQLGANAGSGIGGWLFGSLLGSLFAVMGFAAAAFVIAAIAKSMFNADVSFDEMVRTLGLAYVWNIVGVVGILGRISPALACLIAPVTILAVLLGLAAWFVAAKEALDLDWGGTIISVAIGFVILLVVTFIGGLIMGIFGLGVSAVGTLLGG